MIHNHLHYTENFNLSLDRTHLFEIVVYCSLADHFLTEIIRFQQDFPFIQQQLHILLACQNV